MGFSFWLVLKVDVLVGAAAVVDAASATTGDAAAVVVGVRLLLGREVEVKRWGVDWKLVWWWLLVEVANATEEEEAFGSWGGGGGVLVQTEESEADRESDSSLSDVRWDATEDRGEAPPPPPFACLPKALEVGVFGPPEAVPPPVEGSLSLSSSIAL